MQRQAAAPLSQSRQHIVSSHVLCRCMEKRHKQSHLLLSSTSPGRAQQHAVPTWVDGQGCSDVPQLD